MSVIILCYDCDLELGEEHGTGTYIESIDDYVCDSCRWDYGGCGCCNDVYHVDEMVYIDSTDELVCDDCYYNNFHECVECGEVYREDLLLDGYCGYCYENRYYRFARINDYHQAPPIEFLCHVEDTKQYFGFEFEVDYRGDDVVCHDHMAELLYEINHEDCYYTRDGSLNNGFEIVTQPMTYGYFINKFNLDKTCELLTNSGYRSHDTSTCGMHIHVSKAFFGLAPDVKDLNISKVLMMVDNNWYGMVEFSRRRGSEIDEWAERLDLEIERDDTELEIVDKSKKKRHSKYVCVNISNMDTIEFRFFKGTLKASTILASAQLVKNLCDIAIREDMEYCKSMNIHDIVKYNEYVELNEYMIERGI